MFPEQLKKLSNWVGYKNKIPINPKTGKAARVNDKDTWSTYDEAKASVKKYGLQGIGFIFQPPYIGIDLDHCIVNGIPNRFARRIIAKINSYTEESISGTGVHIICKGVLPRGIKTHREENGVKTDFFEAYQTGRFFTMTGKVIYPQRPLRTIDFDLTSIAPQLPNTIQDRVNSSSKLGQSLSSVVEGNRNNSLTQVAGSLRRRGYKSEEIYELLKAKAVETNLPLNELQTICSSVGRYKPAVDEPSSLQGFLKIQEPVDWICEGLIAKKSIIFFAGLPRTLKTWVLLDLAIEGTRDNGLWLQKFMVKKSKIWFIDQERFKGETQRRFLALLKAKELKPEHLENLTVTCGSIFRLDVQSSYEYFRQCLSVSQPDIVIIDSFSTFHTKNAAVKSEIQPVLESIKKLRDEFNCTFIFIHHETKGAYSLDKRNQEPSFLDAEGSIALPAASEFFYNVRKHNEESSIIYNTKNSMAITHSPFSVKIEDLVEDKSKIQIVGY